MSNLRYKQRIENQGKGFCWDEVGNLLVFTDEIFPILEKIGIKSGVKTACNVGVNYGVGGVVLGMKIGKIYKCRNKNRLVVGKRK